MLGRQNQENALQWPLWGCNRKTGEVFPSRLSRNESEECPWEPGLDPWPHSAQWVKDPALLWAVVYTVSYSSDSTPSLGTSICCRCVPKKTGDGHCHAFHKIFTTQSHFRGGAGHTTSCIGFLHWSHAWKGVVCWMLSAFCWGILTCVVCISEISRFGMGLANGEARRQEEDAVGLLTPLASSLLAVPLLLPGSPFYITTFSWFYSAPCLSWPSCCCSSWGFELLISLTSAYTFVKIPFIKLVSNYPVEVCHLFPAKAFTDTVGNHVSSSIFSIIAVTFLQNRMIMLSAEGKFSLIGRKQIFPSQCWSFAIRSQSLRIYILKAKAWPERHRVFVTVLKVVPPFTFHVHLQTGQDPSWLI